MPGQYLELEIRTRETTLRDTREGIPGISVRVVGIGGVEDPEFFGRYMTLPPIPAEVEEIVEHIRRCYPGQHRMLVRQFRAAISTYCDENAQSLIASD